MNLQHPLNLSIGFIREVSERWSKNNFGGAMAVFLKQWVCACIENRSQPGFFLLLLLHRIAPPHPSFSDKGMADAGAAVVKTVVSLCLCAH